LAIKNPQPGRRLTGWQAAGIVVIVLILLVLLGVYLGVFTLWIEP
jgi:hypothetical protein